MAQIDTLLEDLVARKGSDLHLSAGRKPVFRVSGALNDVPDSSPLTSDDVLAMMREILPEENIAQLQRDWDTDCAYAIPGLARFRVNAYRDMNGVCAVLRVIPDKIPSFEDLNLPEALRSFCLLSKGLVVVTGPTGSGKSTTLSAMIDYINRTRNEHIITIEDPIEFVHTPAKCVINQREVHRDTRSFATALRAALREDPDIVLIGEMRDLETMEIAIETAETGHLVFATLHTNAAATTVERMIDKFPAERQNQIRSMLSDTLKGVVAQTLCPKIAGGRVAAFEVLVVNTPVAALIREGKTHMLQSVIQTGRNIGMQTFSDELTRLATKGLITPRDAYIKAVNKDEIATKFKMAGLSLDFLKAEEEAAQLKRQKAAAEKIAEWRMKAETDPKNAAYLAEAAWHLATTPFEVLRSPKEAYKLADRATSLTRENEPRALAALGAAHAVLGNFRKALDATRKAQVLYNKAGDRPAAAACGARITLFEQNKPFFDE